MRILHSADWHAKRDRWPEVLASIRTMRADAVDHGCDLFVISGDLADGPMQDSERDCFDALCRKLQELADIAPVAIIYGTPSHDAPGSLEVLERLQAEHSIVILRPGKAYFLDPCGRISETRDSDPLCGPSQLLLFGVPEPNKKWLLAEAGATGKEASDAAVRDAMRALLLGLGGLRRQHSDLPCLLMYHGQVSGARTGTGFGVESGTGLAVSRDDLAAVGADYYALGDIHEPQQIGDLPAYYPGSIYPINWGETHKAGCNVVEIGQNVHETGGGFFSFGCMPWRVTVSRLDFPHPQRVKIVQRWPDVSGCSEYKGKLAWLEITATKEESASINLDVELNTLLKFGALEGSRVTLNILPTETVRAGEITKKKHLREKVQVYSENSDLTPTETALEKADELEREAAQAGQESGAKIRITRLRLRGAKGIWKNQKKDEVDLDLDELGAGVIALVGPNGRGKTTLIENMHPWPQMLTRDGKLKDHFRLRDSCRELYFTDERTGIRYRSTIQINAAIASGSAEYWLHADAGQGWHPVEGINGRLEPYEAAITRLFGSLEMYLRTAFQTQRPSKNAPDLAEATKGEKKALFAELAGIDYLDTYRAEAKTRADALDSDLLRLEATIDAASDVDEVIRKASEAIEYQRQAETAAGADEARAKASLEKLTTEREALAKAAAALDRSIARKADIEREISSLLAEVAEAEKSIEGFRKAAAGRDQADTELARIKDLETEAAALREEKAKVEEDYRKALVEFQEEGEGLRLYSEQLRHDLESARKANAQAEQDLAVAKAKLSAPVADTCPTCGQTLPADRLEAIKHAHEEAEALVHELEIRGGKAFVDLKVASAAYEDNARAFSERVKPEYVPFPGVTRLAEIEADLAFVDTDSLRAIIRKADEAAVRIEEADRRKADAESRASIRSQEREELALEISGGLSIRDSLSAKDLEIQDERDHVTAAHGAASAARAFQEAAERNLADAQTRAKARDEAATKRDSITLERDDWRFLERACGPDGIQALELDALAPSIATVANRLLEEAYGSRYAIRFDTTRMGGKGARAKQIEDFLVQITDSETGEEQEISTLSGGESVWIKRALYDAFAAIRAQNTGVQFLTAFQDETDGALDPEARMKYLRMLEAAHKESGRYQTILITHSRELQAMVSQIIDVTALGPASEEAKGEAA